MWNHYVILIISNDGLRIINSFHREYPFSSTERIEKKVGQNVFYDNG